MSKKILNITFFLLSVLAVAQTPTTYLSKNNIEVGEKIVLTYSIPILNGAKLKFSPQTQNISSRTKSKTGLLSSGYSNDIEILTPFKDTVLETGGSRIWSGTYEITVWDSGTFVIEGPSIILADSTYFFPSAFLSASLMQGQKGQDIYDIKEAFADVEDTSPGIVGFIKNNWWWLLIVLFIIIGIIVYLKFFNKSKPIEKIKEMNLKDRTLFAIDSLEKARLWEKGRIKEHHVELSFILRSYLTARYEINLFEKTTKESQLLLTKQGLNSETVKVISTILASSDMVKFAKSEPEELEILKLSQLTRQIVAETSPIEFEHAE